MANNDGNLIDEIHDSYSEGKLDYLAGAGTSIDAGLPNWSTLNNRLLKRFFHRQLRPSDEIDQVQIPPEPDELHTLAEVFTQRLSRDSVVDLVRNSLENKDEFTEMLREALYADRGEVELKPLQYELAAAVSGAEPNRILTTNFDDLLERAFCRLHGLEEPEEIREELAIVFSEDGFTDFIEDGSDTESNQFVHLHGFLPPDNGDGEELVLSEQDFWRTSDDWPTQTLRETLMDSGRDLLVVGMSLADPRLRGVLFERANCGGDRGKVFVLLDKQTGTLVQPLARRRAYSLLALYEEQYWEDLRVKVHFVENFELLPLYLRQIRLGDAPGKWCAMAREFLDDRAAPAGRSFEDLHEFQVQREASYYLEEQLTFIRRKFEVPRDEELTLGFFVPSDEPEDSDVPEKIRLAFRYNDGFAGDDYQIPLGDGADSSPDTVQGVPEEHANRRELAVDSVEDAQGAAGYAFVTGAVTEARHSSAELNREFDKEMREDWDGGRTFSSLLCVPIYGSEDWVPLGVGFVSSNRRNPFWAGFSSNRSLDLNTLIRASFRELLGYQET